MILALTLASITLAVAAAVITAVTLRRLPPSHDGDERIAPPPTRPSAGTGGGRPPVPLPPPDHPSLEAETSEIVPRTGLRRPTETELIDDFLRDAARLVEARIKLDDLRSRVAARRNEVLRELPNYTAFAKAADEVLAYLITRSDHPTVMGQLQEIVARRERLTRAFQRLGADNVKPHTHILTYSHSVRVAQFLSGVPREIQQTCTLYIAECRPKSLSGFDDAVATLRALAGGAYQTKLVPDSVALNFLQRRTISLLLLGAHAVVTRDSSPVAFVNTTGSQALATLAHAADAPVKVIAERDKHVDEAQCVFEMKEVRIPPERWYPAPLTPAFADASIVNIGYEYCDLGPHVALVSEDTPEIAPDGA